MSTNVRVLVVGLGTMGLSHARAYQALPGLEIAGLCSRRATTMDLPETFAGLARFDDYEQALAATTPDAVCICTWPDTHASFALRALEAGAHLFVEKPLAETVAEAEQVAERAAALGRKVVVGYILRHHPSWTRFVEIARTLGKPLVMRMNLNQQSSGDTWQVHKHLMRSLSPIVDCGVHYVDMMCLMTRAKPVRVHAIGARVSDEIAADMYNYGQLQVVFDDGSIGWYEAGWGPMMSETAFFVKDVVGPAGSVGIVATMRREDAPRSDDVDAHTQSSALLRHHSALDAKGDFAREDELIDLADEPDHDELCRREQRYLLDAIRDDVDLTQHLRDAVEGLRIVLAADESVRSGQVIEL